MHFNGLKSFLCHFCINLSSGNASTCTCLPKLAFLKKCPEKRHTLWTLSFQNISINMRTSRKHGTPDPICSEAAPADRSVVSASLIDWLILRIIWFLWFQPSPLLCFPSAWRKPPLHSPAVDEPLLISHMKPTSCQTSFLNFKTPPSTQNSSHLQPCYRDPFLPV